MQSLQLRKHMAEMFAVPARLSTALAVTLHGPLQRRAQKHFLDRGVEIAAQHRGIDAEARRGDVAIEIVGIEQFRDIGPEIVERGLRRAESNSA